ncbi:MAG: heavy metal translocating P-type ATPase [Robiginitomaculum sp.]|nr:MAG: heavy metal translocating P-type ATPase [Robiginitomaculum sp.]
MAGAAADPLAFVRTEDDGLEHLDLLVRGARCAGCISKIEKGVNAISGVRLSQLNLSTGKLSVNWVPGAADPGVIARTVADLGYQVSPYDPGEAEVERDKHGRFLLLCMAVAGFAAMNIMLFSVSVWAGFNGEMQETTRTFFHWLSALIALPAAAFSGQPFFRSAFASLRKGKANMDVPISLAVLLALGVSLYETITGGDHTYFDAAIMLLFFLLIGRWLDHRLRGQTRLAARELLSLQAATANRLDQNGDVQAVQARDIEPGDHIILWPGDRAPVDGIITEGRSDVDMALVSGESAPDLVQSGDAIRAGMVNLTDKLVLRATARTEDSLLAELTRLVEAGETARGRFVKLADRAAQAYVPIVHTLAALSFVGWILIGAGVHHAVLIAAAVLIITCPCALGLAAPAVQIVAVGRLFKRGILVKAGDALERMAEIDTVLLDKTGTLTLGKPRLVNTDEISADTLEFAAKLARSSRHPLSRAIADLAGPGGVANDAEETPGHGVEGTVDGARARLGRAEWAGVEKQNETTSGLWLVVKGQDPVHFIFEDALRVDAAKMVAGLKARNLSVEMLSGDREAPAKAAAAKAGIDIVSFGLTPQEKISRVEALVSAGKNVLMVGDGLNDAPALAAANVSLSLAGATDASQAAADMVLQGEKLSPILAAYDVSRAARGRILQNFGFAAGYNMIAVPLAVFGFVTPMIAAIAMSSSSIVVTLNALRPFMIRHKSS